MLLLAATLYDWAAFLANRAEAGDDASLNPAEEEISSTGMEKPEEFRESGQEVGNGGPPAHWLELVRQHAPELLGHEDSHSGETYGSWFPENGMSKTEDISVDTSRSTNHTDLARANPQRPGNRPDDFRSPSASVVRRSGSSDDPLHFSEGEKDQKTGFPQQRSHEWNPFSLKHKVFSKPKTNYKGKTIRKSVNDPLPKTQATTWQTSVVWGDNHWNEPETPSFSPQKQSVSQDDKLAYSTQDRTETTEEFGHYAQKQERSESASPVATGTSSNSPERFFHKTEIKNRKIMEPDQGEAQVPTTTMNSTPEKARLPTKSSFPFPGHKAISALKNYFFTDNGKRGAKSEQKGPAIYRVAATLPPSGSLSDPQKQTAAVEPLRKSDNHEPINRSPANRSVNKAIFRQNPETSSPQERTGVKTAKSDFADSTEKEKGLTSSTVSGFNIQSGDQVFSESPVWPSLPDEPEKKDFPVVSQDRWPTLPENDSGLIHQLLTEARTTGAESAERIRRLEQEQRGLFWNG